MSYQVLARKWRPQVFKDVIGQEHVVKTLQNALGDKRIAHAFLFAGQRGIGKTTIARILAKALNCQEGPAREPCGKCISCREIAEGTTMDVLEIDGASNTGVDDIRELRESVKYVPSRGRYKIYIIDEVHMLSNSAFNALLKTLEEPPAHVIFMFATTEPRKIPPTVLSRCQCFDLHPLPLEVLVKQLQKIASSENIEISGQGLRWLAREAEGSMRDAQSILERVISFAGKQVKDEDVIEVLGIVDWNFLVKTSQALLSGNGEQCLIMVRDLFRLGYDTRQFYQAFLEHLRNLIVVKTCKNPAMLTDLSPEELEELGKQVRDIKQDTLQRLFDIWLKAEDEMYRSSMPQIVLEMILLKMLYVKDLLPLDDALARLDALERRVTAGKAPGGRGMEYKSMTTNSIVTHQVREDTTTGGEHSAGDGACEVGWDNFVAFVRKEKPLLAALLDHGSFLRMDMKKIELGFPRDSLFLESARDGDNTRQIKKMCEKFFGRKLQVNIKPLEGTASLDESLKQEEREQVTSGNNGCDPSSESLVKEALSIFGGRIVEVKYGEKNTG